MDNELKYYQEMARMYQDKIPNLLTEIECLLGMGENEMGFVEICNHIPMTDWIALKEKWIMNKDV
jgi:hypothetical protein